MAVCFLSCLDFSFVEVPLVCMYEREHLLIKFDDKELQTCVILSKKNLSVNVMLSVSRKIRSHDLSVAPFSLYYQVNFITWYVVILLHHVS